MQNNYNWSKSDERCFKEYESVIRPGWIQVDQEILPSGGGTGLSLEGE